MAGEVVVRDLDAGRGGMIGKFWDGGLSERFRVSFKRVVDSSSACGGACGTFDLLGLASHCMFLSSWSAEARESPKSYVE